MAIETGYCKDINPTEAVLQQLGLNYIDLAMDCFYQRRI